jgi:hypothetical protein
VSHFDGFSYGVFYYVQAFFSYSGCSHLQGISYFLYYITILNEINHLFVSYLSFILVFVGSWRVFRIRRLTEDGVRTQLNRWLVSWFALSLLATVAWMCLYWCSCTSNNTPKDNTQKNCLWRHADIYMNIVIITAFVTNLTWLIRLSSIDPKKVRTIPYNGFSFNCQVVIHRLVILCRLCFTLGSLSLGRAYWS